MQHHHVWCKSHGASASCVTSNCVLGRSSLSSCTADLLTEEVNSSLIWAMQVAQASVGLLGQSVHPRQSCTVVSLMSIPQPTSTLLWWLIVWTSSGFALARNRAPAQQWPARVLSCKNGADPTSAMHHGHVDNCDTLSAQTLPLGVALSSNCHLFV